MVTLSVSLHWILREIALDSNETKRDETRQEQKGGRSNDLNNNTNDNNKKTADKTNYRASGSALAARANGSNYRAANVASTPNRKGSKAGASGQEVDPWLVGAEATAETSANAAANSEPVYYFAFGSNMSSERLTRRGVKFSRAFGAKLEGYELAFNKVASRADKEGFANIIPSNAPEGGVEGVVYETTAAALNALDKYEGAPTNYYRQTLIVKNEAGREYVVVAYVAQTKMTAEGLLPSREYLNHLLGGKRYLSAAYHAKLVAWETAPVRPPVTTSFYGNKLAGKGGNQFAYYNRAGVDSFSSGLRDWSRQLSLDFDSPLEPEEAAAAAAAASDDEDWLGTAGYNSSSNTKSSSLYSNHDSRKLLAVLDALGLSLRTEQRLFRLAQSHGVSVLDMLRHLLEESLQG